MRDSTSKSGFSIVEGLFPICYNGLHSLLGVSKTLLLSVQGTPHSKAGPFAKRPSRVGLPSNSFLLKIRFLMSCSSLKSCLFHSVNQQMFTKAEIVVSWLMELASTHNMQPDVNQIHLPYGKKRQVWSAYIKECESRGDLVKIAENKFNEIWSDRVPHIKVRTFHRFARQCFLNQNSLSISLTFTLFLA